MFVFSVGIGNRLFHAQDRTFDIVQLNFRHRDFSEADIVKRFGDRLRVEVEAEKDTHSARVPLLTLQPLIENSIRHGIEHRATAIMVRISARQDGTHLFLTVEDDGPGLPEGWSPELQGGLGLSNIRERLRGLYGEDQEFTIENRAEGGAVATICIPLRTGTSLPPRAERSRGGVGGGVSQKAGVPW